MRDLFATLDRVRPEGVRYASTRVADGSTFVILFELAEGIEDPRTASPEYLRFLEQLKGWVDGPPGIEGTRRYNTEEPRSGPLRYLGTGSVRRVISA